MGRGPKDDGSVNLPPRLTYSHNSQPLGMLWLLYQLDRLEWEKHHQLLPLGLQKFPKDSINEETVELLQAYFSSEDYTFESAKKVSSSFNINLRCKDHFLLAFSGFSPVLVHHNFYPRFAVMWLDYKLGPLLWLISTPLIKKYCP